MLDAFAADGVLDRDFPLPEFKRGQLFPARHAISFHLVDYVAHSWDVTRTLGLRAHLDPPLLDMALTVARLVPGGDARLEPGAAFAPGIDWPGGSRLDQNRRAPRPATGLAAPSHSAVTTSDGRSRLPGAAQ